MMNFVQPPVNSIIVGKIIGVYGILGWVKIISFTDKSDDIFNFSPWFVLYRFQWKLIRVTSWKIIKRYYLAKILDIDNRELAMSLTHSELIIDSDQLPSLCNNEYYWKDIIGCKVITIIGYCIGYVISIMESIAHDILVVQRVTNMRKNKDCLIPFVENKIIKDVNLSTRLIVVDWDI